MYVSSVIFIDREYKWQEITILSLLGTQRSPKGALHQIVDDDSELRVQHVFRNDRFPLGLWQADEDSAGHCSQVVAATMRGSVTGMHYLDNSNRLFWGKMECVNENGMNSSTQVYCSRTMRQYLRQRSLLFLFYSQVHYPNGLLVPERTELV